MNLTTLFLVISLNIVFCDKSEKPKKKKDITFYNDADIEKLYDQWEENDEDELEEDEKPEWKRKPTAPKIDLSDLNSKNPEDFMKLSKKGKTLMLFATVSGTPTRKDTEQITQLWQSSLYNANIEVQRYVTDDNRVLLVVNDGSLAWQIKDFLVKQERCYDVTIEGKSYDGLGKANGVNNKKKKEEL